MRVLILEDDINDATLLKRELNKAGADIVSEVVQTRQAFEEALDRFKPDIILSDYSLPAFDGLSAFHIKQRNHPGIPFIIVSGVIGEENAVELIKTGVTDYILKNNLSPLLTRIKRAVDEAASLRQKGISDELLKVQNEKLFEIGFLQSHQVRKPVTDILELINAMKYDDVLSPVNFELIPRIEALTRELDAVILQIVQKTKQIQSMG